MILNKKETVDALKELIKDAYREIIIVSPYIHLSVEFLELITEASKKAIEITIVYRQDKVLLAEINKLSALSTVTLLAHPEIHAKMYVNESSIIISSMNLYSYSIENNREISVQLKSDGSSDYEKALSELKTILKTATIVKQSDHVEKTSFEIDFLQSEKIFLEKHLPVINKLFVNKIFSIEEKDRKACIKAKEYADDINVYIDHRWNDHLKKEFIIHRCGINPLWSEEIMIKVQKEFSNKFKVNSFNGYKIYWDYYTSSITLYKDSYDFKGWVSMDFNESVLKYKDGIDEVVTELAKIKKSV